MPIPRQFVGRRVLVEVDGVCTEEHYFPASIPLPLVEEELKGHPRTSRTKLRTVEVYLYGGVEVKPELDSLIPANTFFPVRGGSPILPEEGATETHPGS